MRRVLRLFFRTSMNRSRGFGSMNSEEHYAVARKVAGEGIVLLKNKGGILPLDTTKALSVLVVGENAIKMMTVGGGRLVAQGAERDASARRHAQPAGRQDKS